MSVAGGPDMIQDGLVLSLDAADRNSYPGSGTTWSDISGNSYSGTLTNGPTFNTSNGGSIVFDGTNDYVAGNSVAALNSYPITIMGWVLIIGGGEFVNKYTSGDLNGYRIGLSTVGINFYYFTDGTFNNYTGDYDAYSGTILNNTWTHITVTVNNTGANLYINTSLVGTRSWVGTPKAPTTNTNVSLGTYSAGNYLNGRIANVQIYNRALLTAEILQNYNAQKSRFNL